MKTLIRTLCIFLLVVVVMPFLGFELGRFYTKGEPIEAVAGATYYGTISMEFNEDTRDSVYWLVGRRVSLMEDDFRERLRAPVGSIRFYELSQKQVHILKSADSLGKVMVSTWLYPR